MTIAIIGTGSIGSAIANDLANSNEEILLVNTHQEKAEQLAQTLGNNFSAVTADVALQKADILILSIWFAEQMKFINNNFKALADKIIIDPSNPIAFDENGNVYKTLPDNTAAGEILQQLLPISASYVKAFGTLQASSLADSAHLDPKAILYYYSAKAEAKKSIEALINAAGFKAEAVELADGKTLDLEVGGRLHELGGLGKVPFE